MSQANVERELCQCGHPRWRHQWQRYNCTYSEGTQRGGWCECRAFALASPQHGLPAWVESVPGPSDNWAQPRPPQCCLAHAEGHPRSEPCVMEALPIEEAKTLQRAPQGYCVCKPSHLCRGQGDSWLITGLVVCPCACHRVSSDTSSSERITYMYRAKSLLEHFQAGGGLESVTGELDEVLRGWPDEQEWKAKVERTLHGLVYGWMDKRDGGGGQ